MTVASVPQDGADSPPLTSRGRRFLTLQNEREQISYLLDTAVLAGIEQHAVSGLHDLPRRGLENAGVLYGYVEQDRKGGRVVVIDGSEPIASEHKFGPDFKLSDNDRSSLPQSPRRLAGVYRSHTRPALPPARVDDELWRLTNLPEGVLLIVHPAARASSTATLYRPTPDGFAAFTTFPLRLSALEKEGYVIVAEPGASPPVEAAQPATRMTAFRWAAWTLAAVLVALTFILSRPPAAQVAEESRERTEAPRVVEQVPPTVPAPEPEEKAPRPRTKRATPPPERFVAPARITLELVPENALRRLWNRIPGARKLQRGFRGGGNYAPPVAGTQPSPTYSLRLARELADLSPLVVRLNVDERGRVRSAKLLSRNIRPEIRDRTVSLLRRWQFRPARSNGRLVPSRVNVVLHF